MKVKDKVILVSLLHTLNYLITHEKVTQEEIKVMCTQEDMDLFLNEKLDDEKLAKEIKKVLNQYLKKLRESK